MAVWLIRLLRGDGERLLSLLIRAHDIDEEQASMSRAFRAGLKIGLKYPAIGREVLGEPEYQI